MLEAALRYPTTGEAGLERLLIGGVLLLLSALVIPAFLVFGYLVRSLAAVAAGATEPPGFDDWEGLLVDGIKAFVVAIAYGIVPVVLAAAALVPVSVGVGTNGDGPTEILTGLGIVAVLLSFVVVIAVAYVVMAAFSNFAVEGRLGAAFDVGTVGRLATSEPYVVAVVLAIVVQVALGMVITAAIVFTFGLALFVFIPLGAFVNFWVSLVTVSLFGTAYRETFGVPADG